ALAHDQTVETGGDTEEMTDRCNGRMMLELRSELIDGKMMKLGQILGHQVGIQGSVGSGPTQIDLHPVARAQNHRFAAVSAREIVQGARDRLFVEGQTFADFQRRFFKIAADRQEFHAQCSSFTFRARRVVLNQVSAGAKRKPTLHLNHSPLTYSPLTLHGVIPRTNVWEEARVNSNNTKATIVSWAKRRPFK